MFKITITKVEFKDRETKEYHQLRQPYPNEGGNNKADDDDPQYGYVSTTKNERVETTILSQEMDELDIREVIRAINKL